MSIYQVFDCEEDTGIPAVRQFVQKIAEQKEKEATKRLIQNLALFISDIEDYLGITVSVGDGKDFYLEIALYINYHSFELHFVFYL